MKKYGVSSKYNFGTWEHIVYGPFASDDEAQEWLNTKEYDFREREIMNKTSAIKLAGKKAVNNAISFFAW
ncbi:hypothetical protein C817_04602 [Dorea sp. 5-2]|jgi:hypothetical protein|nr:hypothetical protein C817_05949 [Dorea sp. 5-2]EOS74544.1 hypothetical protein C817_04602 [Dorea sp. 5-2]MCI9025816.1 hypothetical protein [Dorea sp.]